jgi:ferredoxin
MYDMFSGLQDWGVPHQRIRYEAFGSASIKQLETHTETVIDAAQSAAGPTISFSRSGKNLSWDANASPLLEFGIAQGIAMDWGCSAGECNTCEVAIKGGRVRYLKTPSEAPEEGNCLPCICVPDSEFLEIDA